MAISLWCRVGPLSNIAVAMRMQPAILPKIREIVLMGGAYGTGNFTPSAEFNIFADPEAARVVFTSGVPLVMMGLDLTNQTVCTPDVIARMERAGGPCRRAVQRHHELHSQNAVRKLRHGWRPGARRHLHRLSD